MTLTARGAAPYCRSLAACNGKDIKNGMDILSVEVDIINNIALVPQRPLCTGDEVEDAP